MYGETNIRLVAKLVSVNKNETDNHLSYFNRLNTLLLDVFKSISGVYELDYKKNSFFKLNMSKLGFRVKELKTLKDDIQCYNLTIKHDQLIKKKKESLYLAEACLELGNFSWFGGHESLVLSFKQSCFIIFVLKFIYKGSTVLAYK